MRAVRNGIEDQPRDPFDGKLDEIKRAVHERLNTPFTGFLSDALHLGNTLVHILRVAEGTYEVTESRATIDFSIDR